MKGWPRIGWPRAARVVGRNLRSRLSGGLLLVIPLTITFLVVRYVFTLLDDLLRPIPTLVGWDFPGPGLALALILLYLIGMLASSRRGSLLLNPGLALTERIPFVRSIYLAAREATQVLSPGRHPQYQRVVLLHWPREGVRALGLVTATFLNTYGEPYVAVYIPTTPVPTSGQLAILPEAEVEDIAISVEQAMRIILSGGILSPEGILGDRREHSTEQSVRS